MITRKALHIPLALACAAALAGDSSPEIRAARARAQEMGRATLDGNFERLVALTPAPLVQMMGGREQAVGAVRQAMQGMKEAGFTITGFELGELGQVVRKGSRIYAIFPTRVLMQSPQGKVQAENYLLGISEDRGATWTFADGAGLQDAGMRTQLFPDLPAELNLPAIHPPVVMQ